ncbi:hypothetical protein SB748_33825, partial [Rhizobium sp. SIMBA_035]
LRFADLRRCSRTEQKQTIIAFLRRFQAAKMKFIEGISVKSEHFSVKLAIGLHRTVSLSQRSISGSRTGR